jgi:hypothetical protein
LLKRVSLWHFHVYASEPDLFHLLYFCPFYLIPFLMVVSIILKFLCSFLYREYINHIHLLNFPCVRLLKESKFFWSQISLKSFLPLRVY